MKKNLVNWIKELKRIGTYEVYEKVRYNGGWAKTVTGLDKTVANGYSIKGDFIETGDYKNYYDDGLYLDSDITGSRKHQEKNYRLIRVKNGQMTLITEILNGGRDWAVDLWDSIEKELGQKETAEQKLDKLAREFIDAAGNKEKALKIIKGL